MKKLEREITEILACHGTNGRIEVGEDLDKLLYQMLPLIGLNTPKMTQEEMKKVVNLQDHVLHGKVTLEFIKINALKKAKEFHTYGVQQTNFNAQSCVVLPTANN